MAPLLAVALPLLSSGQAEPARTVLAHLYYWYPINAGICTHHAPEGHFNRDDVNWWQGELRNAQYAGVDVFTLMYWDVHSYNPAALEVLVQAVREMDAAGEPHPKIAMHLDGIEQVANVQKASPLTPCDLTTPEAKEAVAQAFIHFFSFFQRQEMGDLCFRHNGKLVAFVYRPEYGRVHAKADNAAVDHWRRRFREEMDEELYLVLEGAYYHSVYTADSKWPGTDTDMRCTNADNYYRWDAALAGPLLEERGEFPIATIGPGFDPGGQGQSAAVRDRRHGYTFRDAFRQALRWNAPWLVIETFNCFEEGTDITETREFGRLYLDIAHEYTARLKAQNQSPAP